MKLQSSIIAIFSTCAVVGCAQISTISDGQPEIPASTPSASVAVAAPTAVTKNGTYQGLHLSTYNQDVFLGIPYAQPPLGAFRFTNPQSLNDSFDETRQAIAYSPQCVGYGGDDIGYEVSEDCLTLNVIRPAGYEGQSLPVAVWIHGGGLQMGGAADRRYNLSFIVENAVSIGKPIIGVSIQYRLTSWGFLASQEVQGSGNTNLGLKDQRLALHWIQENIGSFGGDQTKVTIWGESAGALSVGLHLVAYGGRDDKLFRAGIMESGNPINYYSFQDNTQYQPMYNQIVDQTGCLNETDTLNCLRYLPFDQLNAVLNSSAFNGTSGRFNPVVDGDFIQKFGSIQLSEGEFVHVPIISGANTDEGTAFAAPGIENSTAFYNYLINGTKQALVALPAFLADEILSEYPDDPSQGIPAELGDERLGDPYGYEWRRVSAYAGDAVFIANRRQTCQTWSTTSPPTPAYCYRFNANPAGLPASIGVTHFQEVAFVFNNIDGLGYAVNPFENKTSEYLALSKLMSCSWASFVSDLDPNSFRSASSVGGEIAGVVGQWPSYGAGMNIVWDANVTSYVENDTWRKDGIDLINANNLLYKR